MPIDGIDLIKTERVDNVVYALIISKYTTLAEVRDVYDCWEVLDLFEIYAVNAYNKNSINKSHQK